MQAHRVWATWKDEPEDDSMASAAFELRERAEVMAASANKGHADRTGLTAPTCLYVVREETIPRDITFDGKPDRCACVFLGDDVELTNLDKIA